MPVFLNPLDLPLSLIAFASTSWYQVAMTNLATLTIMKFGGTSVQDAEAITRLMKIVSSRSGQRLVVVSALSKVTDGLLSVARLCEAGEGEEAKAVLRELLDRHIRVGRELGLEGKPLERVRAWFHDLEAVAGALATLREVSPKSRDLLASAGELSSSCLVHAAFEKQGHAAMWIDSREIVATNDDFTNAEVDFATTNRQVEVVLKPLLKNQIGVAQGFIGSNRQGATTTLGRGGSDYSAAIYGAALGADKVEIWTDVDGILTTDPRVAPEASVIERIPFLEASEMATFGAKVLHPATIFPALEKKIPVWILNSRNPSGRGTEITFEKDSGWSGIRGIAFKKNVTVVNIHSTRMLGAHGFLKSVFDVFAQYRLSVDLISTSEVNLSLTLDPNSDGVALEHAKRDLEAFSDVEIQTGRAMVSVVGQGIRQTPGLAAKIFGTINDINVQMISMGASELNVSFVIEGARADEAVRRLHKVLIH